MQKSSDFRNVVLQFRRLKATVFIPFAILFEVGLDFFEMVIVVRQRRMNIGECDAREALHDLLGGVPPMSMPNDHVHHADAMADDPRPPAARPGSLYDMLGADCGHKAASFVNATRSPLGRG